MPDFISGKHCRAKVSIDGVPQEIFAKSTRVSEIANEVTDQVNGENRARFQKLTDGYNVEIQCFMDTAKLLRTWIKNQGNEDANLPQLAQNAGLRFEYLDGTAAGFLLKGLTLGPMEIDMGGRTERVMQTVKFKAQYFSEVAAAPR